jgi:hypothetical protein
VYSWSIMNKDLLELYSDYLLSSFSYTTASGLSRMSAGEVSHDKITRFLASEQMDSRALWRLLSSHWRVKSKRRMAF